MKTYCKPATTNVEDWKFNEKPVFRCLEGKMGRKEFQELLCSTGKITKQEIAREKLEGCSEKQNEAKTELAKILTKRIINRKLDMRPIKQFQRVDGLTHKLRDICQESPEQQAFEYIAKNALNQLFKAKILPFQYGSIPKRGQVAGKRKIERILRKRLHNTDCVKGDMTKAYLSITIECVMRLLRRDIGKNKTLLWFIQAVMDNYPGGTLCIGGYLPCWLFNYVMSYVLRYLMQQHQIRRNKRIKYVKAIVCYADDFSVFGNLSQLLKAMKKATRWAMDNLGLKIKPDWQIYKIASFEEERKNKELRTSGSKKRTPGVDMMGYVVRRSNTIIRKRVFRRIRRQVIRAWNDEKRLGYIPWWRACRLSAYKGWIKHSDSQGFSKRYNLKKLFKMASKSARKHGKEVSNEKRILLIQAAGYRAA